MLGTCWDNPLNQFVKSQGIQTGGTKGERRSATSQAPPLLLQRKPYLTGSPPSRQKRRCRQECRVPRVYRGIAELSAQAFPQPLGRPRQFQLLVTPPFFIAFIRHVDRMGSDLIHGINRFPLASAAPKNEDPRDEMLRIISERRRIRLSIGNDSGDTDRLSASTAVNSTKSVGQGGNHRNLERWYEPGSGELTGSSMNLSTIR
jgi:hypothetical protein